MSEKVLTESILIQRAQQEVWDFITTTGNWGKWYSEGLIDVTPGWQVGGTINYVSGSKPMISQFDPPNLLEWGKGTSLKLSEVDPSSTRIEYSNKVGGMFLEDPMLLMEYENLFYESAEKLLEKLRDLLEG
jgi:hypothetical protein